MFHEDFLNMLEYPAILTKLAENTRTAAGRERALKLRPFEDAAGLASALAQTESARKIFDALGAPPVHSLTGLDTIAQKCRLGEIFSIDELHQTEDFLHHCRLLRHYSERAQGIDPLVSAYALAVQPLEEVRSEIARCLIGDSVQDRASATLHDIRMKQQQIAGRIQEKLVSLLRGHPQWFQESFHSLRNGRYVLPVKREYRAQVKGPVLDMSTSGATVFIQPESVQTLQREADMLSLEESNEVLRILAELSVLVAEQAQTISVNRQAMEDIDFAFACGRLGSAQKAVGASASAKRELILEDARHPLLEGDPVPLSVTLGKIRALVITGPNTGGKTVALKTIGLITLMALSGLQVPAKRAVIPLFSGVYCDIGDGQSIAQNLSTFSSHVRRIVRILSELNGRALVLLDELGGGTDPQEGMGLAVAVLEEIGHRGCLMAATSHYPEIKRFAQTTPGFQNARMAFDRTTLSPLYKLEMGEAGESCALYIAQRLGIQAHLLERAWQLAYPDGTQEKEASLSEPILEPANDVPEDQAVPPSVPPEVPQDMPLAMPPPPKKELVGTQFRLGDAVFIPFMDKHGIVYQECNNRGELGVRIQEKNYTLPARRVRPFISRTELYPGEDYDLDIVLHDVEYRKSKHALDKGKIGASIIIKEGKE